MGIFFEKKILKKNRKKGGIAQNEEKFFGKNGIFSEKMKLSTSKFLWDNFRVKSIPKKFLKLVTSKFMKIFEIFDFSKISVRS